MTATVAAPPARARFRIPTTVLAVAIALSSTAVAGVLAAQVSGSSGGAQAVVAPQEPTRGAVSAASASGPLRPDQPAPGNHQGAAPAAPAENAEGAEAAEAPAGEPTEAAAPVEPPAPNQVPAPGNIALPEAVARPFAIGPTYGGILSSDFGPRWGEFHYGIDIAAPLGSAVLAVTDGVVLEAGQAQGFGLWVRVTQDDGTVGVYGHVDRYLVQPGQRVQAGDMIATVGNRGHSTGPHLHYEVRKTDGTPMSPRHWLAQRGVWLN
ncbi:M23 family metallopeptidase [Lolliginicoccus suaedae]|uniref:M23 family metallopeptidase n=1 Tax=Lolliginicoccus suaedae TaxID=2605429 RepID=UPI00165A0A52|nr:M23 family metallopeptidase [Lolliginicoccus suaedae]